MITIQLFNRRVDIERTRIGYYKYHCYKVGENYLYHYKLVDTIWKALLFLIQ